MIGGFCDREASPKLSGPLKRDRDFLGDLVDFPVCIPSDFLLRKGGIFSLE